jgi:hypothetical protein
LGFGLKALSTDRSLVKDLSKSISVGSSPVLRFNYFFPRSPPLTLVAETLCIILYSHPSTLHVVPQVGSQPLSLYHRRREADLHGAIFATPSVQVNNTSFPRRIYILSTRTSSGGFWTPRLLRLPVVQSTPSHNGFRRAAHFLLRGLLLWSLAFWAIRRNDSH